MTLLTHLLRVWWWCVTARAKAYRRGRTVGGMTVAELIARLSKYPPHERVVVESTWTPHDASKPYVMPTYFDPKGVSVAAAYDGLAISVGAKPVRLG